MAKIIIQVLNNRRGNYYSNRTVEGMGDDSCNKKNVVFSLVQNNSETYEELEERVRREARKRGISHIDNID